MADLRIYLGSHVNETGTPTADQKHANRAGALAEFMADQDAFVAFCNETPGLKVYNVFLDDEQGGQVGQHWIDSLSYLVPCQIVDSDE